MPYISANWSKIEEWSDINEFKNKQNVNINWNEKIGQQFTLRGNEDGLKYTVSKVNDDKSVDFRRDDSWTFTAVNPVINSNGTIEWAYSKNGEFTDEKVLNEFLQAQKNSQNTIKTEDTQFVMPPNFEYEQQPVTATPYTPRQSTGSQNNTTTAPPKKETDELPASDPNTKDEYNQLNLQNANSQETPLAVGKIEMSKKDFEEIKPKLQGFKENGSFIKVFGDEKNPDNIKIFFDKNDSAKIENIMSNSKGASLAQ